MALSEMAAACWLTIPGEKAQRTGQCGDAGMGAVLARVPRIRNSCSGRKLVII